MTSIVPACSFCLNTIEAARYDSFPANCFRWGRKFTQLPSPCGHYAHEKCYQQWVNASLERASNSPEETKCKQCQRPLQSTHTVSAIDRFAENSIPIIQVAFAALIGLVGFCLCKAAMAPFGMPVEASWNDPKGLLVFTCFFLQGLGMAVGNESDPSSHLFQPWAVKLYNFINKTDISIETLRSIRSEAYFGELFDRLVKSEQTIVYASSKDEFIEIMISSVSKYDTSLLRQIQNTNTHKIFENKTLHYRIPAHFNRTNMIWLTTSDYTDVTSEEALAQFVHDLLDKYISLARAFNDIELFTRTFKDQSLAALNEKATELVKRLKADAKECFKDPLFLPAVEKVLVEADVIKFNDDPQD